MLSFIATKRRKEDGELARNEENVESSTALDQGGGWLEHKKYVIAKLSLTHSPPLPPKRM